jgi:hypothetical protein
MAYLNRLQTDGNGNIQVVDVTNSTITINTADNTALYQLIDEIKALHHDGKILHLLVLATTRDRLKGLSSPLEGEPFWPTVLAQHGPNPEDWRPYYDDKISQLIMDYHKASGFKVEALFVDGWDVANELDIVSEIKSVLRRKTVLLVDSMALDFAENRTLAKLFDEDEIGGCLVPIWQEHDAKLQTHLQSKAFGVFSHLNTLFHKKFHVSCVFIELAVPTKELLFRRLTNIATKHLALQPEKRIKFGQLAAEQRADMASRILNFPTL